MSLHDLRKELNALYKKEYRSEKDLDRMEELVRLIIAEKDHPGNGKGGKS